MLDPEVQVSVGCTSSQLNQLIFMSSVASLLIWPIDSNQTGKEILAAVPLTHTHSHTFTHTDTLHLYVCVSSVSVSVSPSVCALLSVLLGCWGADRWGLGFWGG